MVKARASSVKTTFFTLSSSSAKALNASSKDVPLTYRVLSGWRTLRFAAARQARPRPTTLSSALIWVLRLSSIRLSSAVGKSHRCTLSGAVGSTLRTRFWYISSAMKGTKGAITLDSVTSTV